MRILPLTVAVALVALGSVARADDNPGGTYDVKYEEMSNNCTNVGMTLGRGVLRIEIKSSTSLVVDIERIPLMNGVPAKGKITAKSKLGPTSIKGLDGTFSVAGRFSGSDGVLQLVFVAEYQAQGKALCTQSWNISGVKQGKTK
ncbi:MAG TPA: hypothetical protein VGO00_27135 [Kofleriaceae bacterium]|jgi:hypothetical protein|nr:hypothetical protein [Kofleriaceae bacterium]